MYDLFAPLGKADKTYSIEEAKQYLIDTFTKLTPEMADLMREAFENGWIDFYPRKGKEGGAFCAGVMWLKQSRILTNYDGYFGSVDTLAHELGHAFHNRQIENHAPLNQDYPMPVAETHRLLTRCISERQPQSIRRGTFESAGERHQGADTVYRGHLLPLSV